MWVLPVASDADPLSGIALSGKFDLSPVRRSERLEMQYALHDTLDAVSHSVRAPDLSDEKLIALLRDEDPDALDILSAATPGWFTASPFAS